MRPAAMCQQAIIFSHVLHIVVLTLSQSKTGLSFYTCREHRPPFLQALYLLLVSLLLLEKVANWFILLSDRFTWRIRGGTVDHWVRFLALICTLPKYFNFRLCCATKLISGARALALEQRLLQFLCVFFDKRLVVLIGWVEVHINRFQFLGRTRLVRALKRLALFFEFLFKRLMTLFFHLLHFVRDLSLKHLLAHELLNLVLAKSGDHFVESVLHLVLVSDGLV